MTLVMRTVALVMLFVGCATAPKTIDEQRDLEARATATLRTMRARAPDLDAVLARSAGYAVFPTIGKGGALVGGAFGRGILYENGRMTGFVKVEQAALGAILGGQSFAELLVLRTPQEVHALKMGDYKFGANAGAVVLNAGAAVAANFDAGVAVYVLPIGGLMVDVSVDGQRFQYQPPAG